MTRQPAAEKTFTVAWPIPREAPVSSMTRRAWLGDRRSAAKVADMVVSWGPARLSGGTGG